MIPPFSHCVAPGCLIAVAVYVAVLEWRRHHRGPHPAGCPCVPCRDLETAIRDACITVGAEVVPGLRRDGKPLTRREIQALRGIEAASGRQEAQP